MEDEEEDVVSTFIVSTCRFDAQLNSDAFRTRWKAMKDERCSLAGAISEFYIDPMLSTDGATARVMRHYRTHLAVTSRDRVPRRLPSSFRNSYINVVELVDGGFPGYVLLREVGVLKRLFDVDDIATTMTSSLPTHVYIDGVNRNAMGHAIGDFDDLMLPFVSTSPRIVLCVRCLHWPTQAAAWPSRRREHNWPDAATVDEVVKGGCDVVSATHRQAVGWLRTVQRRISFFRAETRLLNSWTPVQQIVYHVLRVILATEKFQVSREEDDEGEEEEDQLVIMNYHLKTMMLWTCEMKSSTWWNRSNVVRLCCDVMNSFVQCCESSYCRGYFISDSNLFESGNDSDDGSSKRRAVISQLKSFTDASFLSEWLVENYIFRCAREIPHELQVMLIDVMTMRRVETVVNSLAMWRRESEFDDRMNKFISLANIACMDYCRSGKMHYLDLGIVLRLRREFNIIDGRLDALYASLTCLSLSSKIYFGSDALCDDIVDCVAAVVVPFHEYNQLPSSDPFNLLRKGLRLLQLSSSRFESDGEVTSSVLQILSFAYFRRVERHANLSGYDAIRRLANVYLAILYCITGRYQTVTSNCGLAATTTSRHSSFVVEGQYLPKIDDNVDISLGLVTLYQFLVLSQRSMASNTRPHVAVFTADLFAAYLRLLSDRVSSDEGGGGYFSSPPSTMLQYVEAFSASPTLFCTDAVLFYLTSMQATINATSTPERRSKSTTVTPLDSTEFGRLLVPLAVNRLTSLRRVAARDSRRTASFITTDLQAM